VFAKSIGSTLSSDGKDPTAFSNGKDPAAQVRVKDVPQTAHSKISVYADLSPDVWQHAG
jgi:hypothetical protein